MKNNQLPIPDQKSCWVSGQRYQGHNSIVEMIQIDNHGLSVTNTLYFKEIEIEVEEDGPGLLK